MEYTLYELSWFFFIYSFAGWCQSVALAAVRRRTFVNTGVLNLPFCPIYGVIAVSFSIFLLDLKKHFVFLFIGGMVICAVLTVLTGVILERIFRRKWWESRKILFTGGESGGNGAYGEKPACKDTADQPRGPGIPKKVRKLGFISFTEGGYVSIPMVLGAGLGSVFVLWIGDPLILRFCSFLPNRLGVILLCAYGRLEVES